MGVRFYGVNSRRDLYGILAPPVAANFKTLQFYSVLPDFPFADRWDVNYRIGSKSNDSYDIVNIGRITPRKLSRYELVKTKANATTMPRAGCLSESSAHFAVLKG